MTCRRLLLGLALGLQLTACAGVGGSDPMLYQALSESDVSLAARLMQATLENESDGATRRWENQATGNHGAITPTRTYLSGDGHFCRDYREELVVAGRNGMFHHTACRGDDERWVWL